MAQKLRTVFFGSGPVALKSLGRLRADFDIQAVITKPATLGQMQDLSVATCYAVSNKAELDALLATQPFECQFAILIDFGVIVSKYAIDYFPLGIINSHFSLLPEWRGADPITFAILSGQKKTGVSLMLLSEGMDEGSLLAQREYQIPTNTTTPALTIALIDQSADLLRQIVPDYVSGAVKPSKQPDRPATYSRKLTKDDGRLDWTKSAEELERQTRAFIDWPKSYTQLAGRKVIVTEATAISEHGAVGAIATDNRRLIVHCAQGSLEIEKLKPAGKPEMTAVAFLAGYRQFFGQSS